MCIQVSANLPLDSAVNIDLSVVQAKVLVPRIMSPLQFIYYMYLFAQGGYVDEEAQRQKEVEELLRLLVHSRYSGAIFIVVPSIFGAQQCYITPGSLP